MEQNAADNAGPDVPGPGGPGREHIRRNFTSDNVAPACPAILDALVAANREAAPSYGGDRWTSRLEEVVTDLFETEVRIFPLATGTACNSLALAALTPPWGSVLCDESAHVFNDECGAPEFFTHGAKLVPLPSADGRMDPKLLSRAIANADAADTHRSALSALTLTQATEWGTVYSLDRLRALTGLAHAGGLGVHMDGARFANALVHLGCTPAEATWRAGVDVLSLGATKNGAMAAELLVLFDLERAADMGRRIKRGGHVWSKQRFLSAQLLAFFENDLWLRNARHANEMAARLARGLARQPGAVLPYPCEVNEVFVVLPEVLVQTLEQVGFDFYRWTPMPGVDGTLIRLVTRYDTSPEDVDALLMALAAPV